MVNADVYGGGLLDGTGSNHSTGCPARRAVADAVTAMDQCAAGGGPDLATAALLFSNRDPRITSTVTSFADPSSMTQTLAALDDDMVEPFWDELVTSYPHRSTGSTTARPTRIGELIGTAGGFP